MWPKKWGNANNKDPTEVGYSETSEEQTIFSESEPGSLERLVSSAASPHSLHNHHCKMVRSFA